MAVIYGWSRVSSLALVPFLAGWSRVQQAPKDAVSNTVHFRRAIQPYKYPMFLSLAATAPASFPSFQCLRPSGSALGLPLHMWQLGMVMKSAAQRKP
eukprot:1065821-Pelagomonas_calceolata.AAC.3